MEGWARVPRIQRLANSKTSLSQSYPTPLSLSKVINRTSKEAFEKERECKRGMIDLEVCSTNS